MRYFLTLLMGFAIWFAGCNSAPESGQTTTAGQSSSPATPVPAPIRSRLDAANTQRLMSVVSNYYSLRDALVSADPARANIAAYKLNENIATLKTYTEADTANFQVLAPFIDSIKIGADAITAESGHATTEKKRIAFADVSDAVYQLVLHAELKNAMIYRQYCPMALNDRGAYWLSNETKIMNPYFGKKMLECGEVVDTLN